VVVVTGFLGAGKTTLVNALLARRAGRNATDKLGVIVNELGEVGIDGALLGMEARQVELPGGCVCCVLGDELDATLLELVTANQDLSAILLETTGVAEPLPIAWALERQPIASHVRLAAVVTLVDATNFFAVRPVSATVDSQVVNADVLLVTKAELAGATETARVTAEIATLAPRALKEIGTAGHHAAWLEHMLADPELTQRLSATPDASGHVHDETCRHLDSSAHGIDSVWVPIARPVDIEELEDRLGELPANYVRIKGIVRVDPVRWMVVHRVGPRVSSEPIQPPDFMEGRIVALGPAVSRSELATCVAHALT
jgi:cobalamin biosynthesis protein CobW